MWLHHSYYITRKWKPSQTTAAFSHIGLCTATCVRVDLFLSLSVSVSLWASAPLHHLWLHRSVQKCTNTPESLKFAGGRHLRRSKTRWEHRQYHLCVTASVTQNVVPHSWSLIYKYQARLWFISRWMAPPLAPTHRSNTILILCLSLVIVCFPLIQTYLIFGEVYSWIE